VIQKPFSQSQYAHPASKRRVCFHLKENIRTALKGQAAVRMQAGAWADQSDRHG